MIIILTKDQVIYGLVDRLPAILGSIFLVFVY